MANGEFLRVYKEEKIHAHIVPPALPLHSMARAKLNKSYSGWSQILTQHQSTYLRGPESASIIPPFRTHLIKFSKTVSCEVNLYGLFHVLYLTYQIVSQSYSRVMVLVQLSFHTT